MTDDTSVNDGYDAIMPDDFVPETESPETEVDAVASEDVETTESEVQEDEATEEAAELEEESDEQEEGQPLDPKEEARRRYEERQLQRQQRLVELQEAHNDYVSEATDTVEQLARQLQVDRYAQMVSTNESALLNEFERAKANPDLQIFNPDSKQFNQKLYDRELMNFNASRLQYDEQGNIVKVQGSLYEHLTEAAAILKEMTAVGKVEERKATQKMAAKADVAPSTGVKEASGEEDPFLKGFNSV